MAPGGSNGIRSKQLFMVCVSGNEQDKMFFLSFSLPDIFRED